MDYMTLIATLSLASGAFLLFFGRVSDLFGCKSLIVGSFFTFAVFCLATGFTKSAISLDVLNGVLGMISACSVPPAIGTLGRIYDKPSRRKNAAFACFSAGNPVGYAAGMVLGGVATQLFNWRASFFLLAIIYLVLSVCALFCVPKDTAPKQPLNWATLKRFDIVGVLLVMTGIAMFSAAISLSSDAPQGWATGYVLALLLVGLFLVGAFIFWESRLEDPIMPLNIWKSRNFTVCMIILLLGFMAFPIGTFFIALFMQNVWHDSALECAIHLLPLCIMGILVNVVAALVLHRISNKTLMFVGTSAYVIGCLLLALNLQTDSYWAFCFPSFLLLVIGADLEFNVANMFVMTSLPPHKQGVAGSIFQTVDKLATTIGFGIATAIFNAVQEKPRLGSYYKHAEATQPYSATFLFAVAAALLSLLCVPLLTIGTQGGAEKDSVD